MVIKLRPLAQAGLLLTLLIFSGALVEQIILFPAYPERPPELRALNSATYLLPYGFGLFFLARNLPAAGLLARDLAFVVALAGLALLSIAWSYLPLTSTVEAVQLTLTVVTAIGIVCALDFDRFIRVTVYALLFVLILSLVYIAVFPDWGRMKFNAWSALSGVPQGVFTHRNTFGECAAVGVLVGLAARGMVTPWLRAAVIGVSLLCLLLALSITSLLGCIVTVMAFFMWSAFLKLRYGRVLSLAVVGFAATGLLYVGPDIAAAVADAVGRDLTLTGRTLIWDQIAGLIAERPFLGWGPGAIWESEHRYITQMQLWATPNAHSSFLQVWTDLGVVGLVVALAFLARILLTLLTYPDTGSSRYRFLFLMFVFAVVTSIAETVVFGGNQFVFLLLMAASGYLTLEKAAAAPRRRAAVVSDPRHLALAAK